MKTRAPAPEPAVRAPTKASPRSSTLPVTGVMLAQMHPVAVRWLATQGNTPIPFNLGRLLASKVGARTTQSLRAHTGPAAAAASQAVNARAFTVGTDVFLPDGLPSPGDREGLGVLVEEAHHARQFLEGRVPSSGLSRPQDGLEHEARAVSHDPSPPRASPVSRHVAPRPTGASRIMRRFELRDDGRYLVFAATLDVLQLGSLVPLGVVVFNVPLDNSTYERLLRVPDLERILSERVRTIFNPDGQASQESMDFLLSPTISWYIAEDLRAGGESGAPDLPRLRAFVEARQRVLEEPGVVSSVETWLRAQTDLPTPVDWSFVLPELRRIEPPNELLTGTDRARAFRYDLLLRSLAAEPARRDPSAGARPDLLALAGALARYFETEGPLETPTPEAPGSVVALHSEAFLEHWMNQLVELEYTPPGFDLAAFVPALDEDEIARERDRVIEGFLFLEPPSAVTWGERTYAADLLVGFVLDEWTRSGASPEGFLERLDLDGLRGRAIDHLTSELMERGRRDPVLRAVVRDHAMERARWEILRWLFMAASGMHGADVETQVRLDNVPIEELSEAELAIASDPFRHYTTRAGSARALYGFFDRMAREEALESSLVTLVDELTAAAGERLDHPELAALVPILLAARLARDTFAVQESLARGRITAAIGLRYEDVARIVENVAQSADQFVESVWVPTLYEVAIERLAANRDVLRDWLDHWDERTPMMIARYRLTAAVLRDTAEDLESSLVEHYGTRGTAAYIDRSQIHLLEDAARTMDAHAARLEDPESREDRRGELREAVEGYDQVVADLRAGEYAPWHLGPEIAAEARRRLGIGEYAEATTVGDALARRAVAGANPFARWAIERWQYIETIDEELGQIALFSLLGLLSVASLATGGLAGTILLVLDLAAGITLGARDLANAYETQRMARLDLDQSIQGVTEEEAGAAVRQGWINTIATGVLAAGGVALGMARLGRGAWRRFRSPNIVALEASNPTLLTQLLSMSQGSVRRLEGILAACGGDAEVARRLLGHGTAEEITRLLSRSHSGEGLAEILGRTGSLARAEHLMGVVPDSRRLMRMLEALEHAGPLAALDDAAIASLSRVEPAVLLHFRGVEPVVLGDLAHLAAQDAPLVTRTLQRHGRSAASYLRFSNVRDPRTFARGAAEFTERARGSEALAERARRMAEREPIDFTFRYTADEVEGMVAEGRRLGLDDATIEDLMFVGSRNDKPRTARELTEQMRSYVEVVRPRGYPYRFESEEQFAQFSSELRAGLREIGVPDTDVVVQGSSLRTPSAGDVDVVVLLSDAEYAQILIDYYGPRARYSSGSPVAITVDTIDDFARQVELNPSGFNAKCRELVVAVQRGWVRPREAPSVEALANRLSEHYGRVQVSLQARARHTVSRPTMAVR